MPAIQPTQLVSRIQDAIHESGAIGTPVSPVRSHPRRFSIATPDGRRFILAVYLWTLTPGGRPQLRNEYRIQMTAVSSPLRARPGEETILLGFEPNLNLFAGFDLQRHRVFSTGSPSVQMDISILREAEAAGLSFHRKSNDEIAVGVRPDQLLTYALHAAQIHRYGREARVLGLLARATLLEDIEDSELESLSRDRQRIVQTVSRLSRSASFQRQVLFAYGNRCAVTRLQLRLVDAAHILPVETSGSTDSVRNGIALSPTYHRAFDAGLIYLDESLNMVLNSAKAAELAALALQGGVDQFAAPLGRIFLPASRRDWPARTFVRRANAFRRIG